MSDREPLIITIDGPSGVGKSTISRKVAEALGFTYLDTGAMYRAVAFFLKQQQVDISDVSAVAAGLENILIELTTPAGEGDDVGVLLNNEDISGQIRSPEISMLASRVSAIPEVRAKLTKLQQLIGAKTNIVAEGRDTGTVVFPRASFKFYLDATAETRSLRRVHQLKARGEQADEKEILAMTLTRDKNDSERAIAPLKRADDAILIDTTSLCAEEVLARILEIVAPDRSTPVRNKPG
jgi:cytidylate kinase